MCSIITAEGRFLYDIYFHSRRIGAIFSIAYLVHAPRMARARRSLAVRGAHSAASVEHLDNRFGVIGAVCA
jgi:hypothetical protein